MIFTKLGIKSHTTKFIVHYCGLRISGLITTLTTHGKHRLRGTFEPGFSIIEAKNIHLTQYRLMSFSNSFCKFALTC